MTIGRIEISQMNPGTPKGTDLIPGVDTTNTTQATTGTNDFYLRSDELNFTLEALGISTKQAVLCASTANYSATYSNGSSGIGATLTNAGSFAPFSADGIAPAVGNRVLIKNQTSAPQNGIYTLTTVGDSSSTNWVLTRSLDFNQSGDIVQDVVVFVDEGATNGGLLFQMTSATPLTVGTDSIIFAQFFINPTPITFPLSLANGGTGASLTASNGSLVYSTPSAMAFLATTSNGTLITSAGGTPSISQTLPSAVQGNITSLGTITSGIWNGTIVGSTYGGTGVNNGASTITIGGSVTFSGAHTFAGTLTGNTAVTFPTSGTLATTGGSLVTLDADSGSATVSSGAITISGGTTGLTTTGSSATVDLTGTLAVGNGGTGKSSVTVAPAATSWAGWDANKNMSANSFIEGYTTTATAGMTTTLTVASTFQQYFTGSTTQTVALPVTSTLVLGQSFYIVNNSSGVVTVQSSGGNTVIAMAATTTALVTCILTSGTTAASWNTDYEESGLTIPVSLADGGTNASLTASAGGVVWSDSSKLNILAGTSTSGQLLLSGNAATPAWSTSTYPSTNAVNTLLYASSANVMAALATANSSVLTTSSGGAPTWATSLPAGTGINVTMVMKQGSGGGNYTTSSASFVDVDATNLAYTITIPIGYKMHITISFCMNNTTLNQSNQYCLADSTTTLVAGELDETTGGQFKSISLTYNFNGDGNSHTFKLRYLAEADTATILNTSSTFTPTMTFLMCPSS